MTKLITYEKNFRRTRNVFLKGAALNIPEESTPSKNSSICGRRRPLPSNNWPKTEYASAG